MLPSDLATISAMIDQVQDAAFALKFSAGPGMSAEITRWRNAPTQEFESQAIPPGLAGALAGALETAKSEHDVQLIFADLYREHDV